MKRMKQSRKILACLLLAVLVGAGLSMAVTAQTSPPLNLGDVRVVNALVGLGAVDVYLDNEIIAYGLLPEQATPYFGVPTGRHVIAVRMVNADPLSPPVTDVLIDLAANQSQTAIAYQKRFAEQPTEGTNRAAGVVPLEQSGAFMVLNDDRSQTQLGKSRLTAAHLSPGTPGRLSIAYTDRASLLHEISLEQPYGAIDVDAGVYQLAVVDAESADLNLIERIGALNFHANTLYTMVIVPDIVPQPNMVSAPPVSPAPRVFAISAPLERPTNGFQLRIIHTAHNTDVLDLYIDERLVAQRMNFGQYTEYLGLNDYSHTVALRRRDADPNSPPLAAATIRISEENRNQDNWSLLLLNANQQAVNALNLIGATSDGGQSSQIVNTPGGPLVMVLLPDNIAQTQRGAARVRLLHAIDGALDLSLYASDLPGDNAAATPAPGPTPTPSPAVLLVQPLVYGAEANEVETGEGLYRNLEFRAGGSTIVYTIPEQYLVEGLVYTYVLIGQPAGEPPVQALQLTDFGRGIPQERLYRGVVTSTSEIVNVRDRDNTESSIQGQLTPGTEVEVLGRNQDGSWALIRYTPANQSRPSEGWVLGALVTITRLGDEVNILTLPVVRR